MSDQESKQSKAAEVKSYELLAVTQPLYFYSFSCVEGWRSEALGLTAEPYLVAPFTVLTLSGL